MSCCALVVMLLVQLLAPMTSVWRRIAGDPERINPAVAWSPYAAPTATAQAPSEKAGRFGKRKRRLVLAVAGAEVLLAAGMVVVFQTTSADGGLSPATSVTGQTHPVREVVWLRDVHDNVWCRSFGVVTESVARGVDPNKR